MDRIRLSDAIANLRAELTKAREAAVGKDLQFAVGDVEIELQIEAERSAKAEGGVDWWIFKAGVESAADSAVTHKLLLKLNVADKGGRKVNVGSRRNKAPR